MAFSDTFEGLGSRNPATVREMERSVIDMWVEKKVPKENKERIKELRNFTFMKMIQQPEFAEEFKRMELNQEQYFEAFIKREYPQHLPEWKMHFYEFWSALIKEDTDNMVNWTREHLGEQNNKV